MVKRKPKSLKSRKKPSPKLKQFFDRKYKKQIELARLLNLNRATIWWWLNKNGVPAEYVLTVEKFTEYRVTRYEIRPDIFKK